MGRFREIPDLLKKKKKKKKRRKQILTNQYTDYICKKNMDNFISLGLLINRVSVALSKSLNAALLSANIDLPHSQFVVLRCLFYKDGLSQLDIANLLSKDAATIKRTVDYLERKGLVVRKTVRTLKNSVCITEKGKEIMPQVLKIANETIEEALKGMNNDTRILLFTLLDDIHKNLK